MVFVDGGLSATAIDGAARMTMAFQDSMIEFAMKTKNRFWPIFLRSLCDYAAPFAGKDGCFEGWFKMHEVCPVVRGRI